MRHKVEFIMESVTEIIKDDKVLAIICRATKINDSLKFVTPQEFPLQVGIHNKGQGYEVKPHYHFPFKSLTNLEVQEVFYLLEGKISVDIYDQNNEKFKTVVLSPGDIIILSSGHGVKFLEKTKLIEIKQGPYRGMVQEKMLLKQ